MHVWDVRCVLRATCGQATLMMATGANKIKKRGSFLLHETASAAASAGAGTVRVAKAIKRRASFTAQAGDSVDAGRDEGGAEAKEQSEEEGEGDVRGKGLRFTPDPNGDDPDGDGGADGDGTWGSGSASKDTGKVLVRQLSEAEQVRRMCPVLYVISPEHRDHICAWSLARRVDSRIPRARNLNVTRCALAARLSLPLSLSPCVQSA